MAWSIDRQMGLPTSSKERCLLQWSDSVQRRSNFVRQGRSVQQLSCRRHALLKKMYVLYLELLIDNFLHLRTVGQVQEKSFI